jgi:hypothetical protein
MTQTRLIAVLLAAVVLLSMARGIIVNMVMDDLLEGLQARSQRSHVAACQALQQCPPAVRPNLLN